MTHPSRFAPPSMQGALVRLLLTGLSKAGKSYASLVIAHAIAAGQKFAVIDTEDKARLYAGQFNFDVLVLRGYTPDAYIAALDDAERAGYPVVVPPDVVVIVQSLRETVTLFYRGHTNYPWMQFSSYNNIYSSNTL